MIKGNTVTCPGFYAPQGRQLRLLTANNKLIQQLNHFHINNFRLTNLEMETAGYYAFGRLLGHNIISLNAILANRITNNFAKKPETVIDELIKKVIDRV